MHAHCLLRNYIQNDTQPHVGFRLIDRLLVSHRTHGRPLLCSLTSGPEFRRLRGNLLSLISFFQPFKPGNETIEPRGLREAFQCYAVLAASASAVKMGRRDGEREGGST